MKKMVIGLDGGGTKTLGVLIDESGTILARAVGESSNIQAIGAEKLGQVLEILINELLSSANIKKEEIDHLFAGLAGAGRPADREAIGKEIEKFRLGERYTVDTDAVAALAGAFSGGPGIIVISGTGAICFGKDEEGTMYRCGGWGYLLGDEGSGYYIGQQALIASLKDFDGRSEKTRLRQKIETQYNLTSIDMIISQIYSGKIDRTEIASLAPMVFSTSEEGDLCSRRIIENAGREIGKIVEATARRMGMQGKNVEVALIGSVFNQRVILLPYMLEEAEKISKNIRFIDPKFEPAIGSAILALQKEKVQITEKVLQNISLSL